MLSARGCLLSPGVFPRPAHARLSSPLAGAIAQRPRRRWPPELSVARPSPVCACLFLLLSFSPSSSLSSIHGRRKPFEMAMEKDFSEPSYRNRQQCLVPFFWEEKPRTPKKEWKTSESISTRFADRQQPSSLFQFLSSGKKSPGSRCPSSYVHKQIHFSFSLLLPLGLIASGMLCPQRETPSCLATKILMIVLISQMKTMATKMMICKDSALVLILRFLRIVS